MIDTLFPHWDEAVAPHGEFSVDLVLAGCPSDAREDLLRCTQWSKQDSLEWRKRNTKQSSDEVDEVDAEEPPPAVLLYATKYIPIKDGQGGAVAMVDSMRDRRGGWDLFPHQFISAIWELPAHHFGMFERSVVRIFTASRNVAPLTERTGSGHNKKNQ